MLVTGGAVLAVFALIEFNTGYDFFDHLHHFIPVLQLQDLPFQSLEVRGGKTRVYASSEHPIALGAALRDADADRRLFRETQRGRTLVGRRGAARDRLAGDRSRARAS